MIRRNLNDVTISTRKGTGNTLRVHTVLVGTYSKTTSQSQTRKNPCIYSTCRYVQ